MNNCISMVIVFLLLFSCNNSMDNKEVMKKKYVKIENAKWIIGAWQNETSTEYMSETWIQKNDSTYTGVALYIVGKDTLVSETIVLEQRGNDLFYIPKVKDQNNNQAVEFKLTSSTAKSLVFENPKHDFPSKISYKKITSDSIVAEVSGKQKGKVSSILFPFTKVK